MNKQTGVIITIFIILSLLVGGYLITREVDQSDMIKDTNKEDMPADDATENPAEEMMEDQNDTTTETENGEDNKAELPKYIEYSKVTFDSVSNNRRVLFFYASWCPTCKPADASFMQNTTLIPQDVTLIRVNYNDSDTDQEEKDLAKKYGITYQHTFVQIDSEGNEVTKWNGGQIEQLLLNIE